MSNWLENPIGMDNMDFFVILALVCTENGISSNWYLWYDYESFFARKHILRDFK